MDIIENIIKLKQEKNAVILAHCYQPIEIDEVADYVGDSLYLSQKASQTEADIIIFAGVHFMAQSAKLLSPRKKVLLPNLDSGCEMADMINIQQLREFKSKYPKIPTICYINSTAEVKAECDICCTSSNAVEIIKNLHADEVLFVPDNYLGKWVEYKLKNVKVHTYEGCCPIHQRIDASDILNARKKYPNAKILAHPECNFKVSELSDFTGSTKEIMDYVVASKERQFVIATEKGVVDRLKRDSKAYNWGKDFILLKDNLICENMKKTTLSNIYTVLKDESNEIFISDDVFINAKKCVENMFNLLKTGNLT